MAQNILISGATGLVGPALIRLLEKKGHTISLLTRDPKRIKTHKAYKWDVSKHEIDLSCMQGTDTVIHLAGAPVAGPRWTAKRKKEIIDSRVCSTALLHKAIEQSGNRVTTFISAGAVGFYGDRGDELLYESAAKGTGFLSDCCELWEQAVNAGNRDMRRIIIRIGIVLSPDGGSLPVMAMPVKLLMGAPIGSGGQWIPWIHLDDLAAIFVKAAEDTEMNGIYNGCAPMPVTNKQLTKALGKVLQRPVWPFRIPATLLKIVLGEQYILPLMSTKASSCKLINTDFRFQHETIENALESIYKK